MAIFRVVWLARWCFIMSLIRYGVREAIKNGRILEKDAKLVSIGRF